MINYFVSKAGCDALDVSFTDPSISNYKELEAAIYTELGPGGDACVRLLTKDGIVGSASPSSTAPIVTGKLFTATATTAAADFPVGAVALVTADQAGAFLARCALPQAPDSSTTTENSSDQELRNAVAAVLILHAADKDELLPSWNAAPVAPYAAYTSPESPPYPWNPPGLDLLSKNFPFPVFQLDNVTSANAVLRANYNAEVAQGATNMARMELNMQASGNSSACLAAKSCVPLGGNSILGVFPSSPSPLNFSISKEGGEENNNSTVVLVMAQIDSSSLFHGLTEAADSPLSGLIAMLVAAQVLGNNTSSSSSTQAVRRQYKKRIAFLALMGEPWDFMGSRRVLWGIEQGSAAVQDLGLEVENIAAILEIGQIGRAQKSSATTTTDGGDAFQLYAHIEKSGPSAASSLPLRSFLQASSSSESENNQAETKIELRNASDATPGLPPCSTSSFLRVRPDIPAVVLEEFKTQFLNTHYHSQYDDDVGDVGDDDDDESVDFESAITATAIFLARALHTLAHTSSSSSSSSSFPLVVVDDSATVPPLPVLDINRTAVRESVVALMDCLMRRVLGMGCPLVASLMTTSDPGPAPHYVGILRTVTEGTFKIYL